MVGQQCCCYAGIMSRQQKCADRKILIRISPWSLIKVPRPQSIAISKLESAVSPRLNVSLYSYYQPNSYEASSNNPVISCDNVHIYRSFLMS